MKKQTRYHHFSLTIQDLHKSGFGRGIWEREGIPDAIVEVPFTLPEDVISVSASRKRGGVFHARLETIEKPSPERITPRCPHFGSCGGCRLQHMPYENQLAFKERLVRQYFAGFIDAEFHPIMSCDSPWAYRNKMEFSFSMNSAGEPFLGLIQNASRGKVFNLQECYLTNSWFVQGVQAARSWWKETGLLAYHPHKNTGSLRTLIVREGMRTGDRMAMLTVSGNPEFALNKQQIDLFTAYMRDALEPMKGTGCLSLFLRIQQIAKGKPTEFFEMHLDGPDVIRERLHIQMAPERPHVELEFTISPSAFFQPNTMQAEKLYSLALQHAQLKENSIVYDLYCGTGTLGICAAGIAKEVVGIELSPESSLDARTNAKRNKIENIVIYTGDVGKVLEEIGSKQSHPKPDVVLVDPPRAGLDAKAMEHLLNLQAQTIVYISCNPATQAENCKELCAQDYSLKLVQPVDQFPHTPHIENIAILTRNYSR